MAPLNLVGDEIAALSALNLLETFGTMSAHNVKVQKRSVEQSETIVPSDPDHPPPILPLESGPCLRTVLETFGVFLALAGYPK